MGKILHSFLKKYQLYISSQHQTRSKRKKWIRSMTDDIVKFSPSNVIYFKYSLPTEKINLETVLGNASKTKMSVQGCYMYIGKETCSPLQNEFPICQYLQEDCLAFSEKFILKHIHFYISIFEERILSFIATLYNDLWRLALQLFLSAPIIGQHQSRVTSINRVYLDEKDYYIVERLLGYSAMNTYDMSNIFGHTMDTINNMYDKNFEKYLKLLGNILVCISLEPLKKSNDMKYMSFHESSNGAQKYLSLQFFIPRSLVPVNDSHINDIKSHTITILSERTKMLN